MKRHIPVMTPFFLAVTLDIVTMTVEYGEEVRSVSIIDSYEFVDFLVGDITLMGCGWLTTDIKSMISRHSNSNAPTARKYKACFLGLDHA